MKKIAYLLTISLIAGSLFGGCSDENTTKDPSATATPGDVAPTATPGDVRPTATPTPTPTPTTTPTATPTPIADGECPGYLPC